MSSPSPSVITTRILIAATVVSLLGIVSLYAASTYLLSQPSLKDLSELDVLRMLTWISFACFLAASMLEFIVYRRSLHDGVHFWRVKVRNSPQSLALLCLLVACSLGIALTGM